MRLGVKREKHHACATRKVWCYQGPHPSRNESLQGACSPKKPTLRTLSDAMRGADVFVGCSVKGAVNAGMIRSMAPRPIVFAMANPDPEITYEEAKSSRDDVILATGRSDYPNQVNNVLGFPFIFAARSTCARRPSTKK